MRLHLWLFTFISLLVETPAIAVETAPSDVSVTMTANPSDHLLPNEIVNLTITVTNHGPEVVHFPSLYSSFFFDELVLGLASNDCGLGFAVLDREESWSYLFLWYAYGHADLAVGESRTCHAKVALSSEAPASFAFTFSISEEYVDLDPSNNVATVNLQLAAVPVPVDSPLLKYVLALLLGSTAIAFLIFRSAQCLPA